MAYVKLSQGCLAVLGHMVDSWRTGSYCYLIAQYEGVKGSVMYNQRPRQARILVSHGYLEEVDHHSGQAFKAYRATPAGIARHDIEQHGPGGLPDGASDC